MIVIDTTTMLLLMFPGKVRAPIDTKTKLPVDRVEARIEGLISQIRENKSKVIIPSPAFSELLVKAGQDTQALIDMINKDPVFRIEPFDTMAAIEVAIMARNDIAGDQRSGADEDVITKAKLKYDRQIVAIAKVHGAKIIYSDDRHIHELCNILGLEAIRLQDIPVPANKAQTTIDFPDEKEKPPGEQEENEEIREEDLDGI
ncbi:MAG TPA: PIN domain-containing protein [Deltaproteobacteria bacterium]|nr:PIN domain-containing protein [Deltaproteobacteria bacterium]HPA07652.1 PIN domain-containing protein [Methanoregulaceae archaeon]